MKRNLLLISAAVCVILAVWFVWKTVPKPKEPTLPVEPTVVEPVEEPQAEPEPYVSPIDFDYWKGECADIYAWLSIPGTDISYPVVQHPTEYEYYLNRDIYGQPSADAALFTQVGFNGLDFSDPVTVIYGHRRNNGAMFGQLQPLYLGDKDFSEINQIVIYLPDKELHYQIFACVPHSNEHILYHYNFSDKTEYQRFLDSVYNMTDPAANYDMSAAATTDDTLLILSTCLKTNRTNRFLVIGKLVETVETGPAA